jgi:hypothetical protein
VRSADAPHRAQCDQPQPEWARRYQTATTLKGTPSIHAAM